MATADGCNLCVGGPNRPSDALPLNDNVGIVGSSRFVEGKNSVLEVIAHHCFDLVRKFCFPATRWQTSYSVK